jgi:hypothetical protein
MLCIWRTSHTVLAVKNVIGCVWVAWKLKSSAAVHADHTCQSETRLTIPGLTTLPLDLQNCQPWLQHVATCTDVMLQLVRCRRRGPHRLRAGPAGVRVSTSDCVPLILYVTTYSMQCTAVGCSPCQPSPAVESYCCPAHWQSLADTQRAIVAPHEPGCRSNWASLASLQRLSAGDCVIVGCIVYLLRGLSSHALHEARCSFGHYLISWAD